MCTVAPVIDNTALRKRRGDAIKEARAERTRRDVVRAMEAEGYTATEGALAFWENGERGIPEAASVALARALGVPWSHLFALDDEVA